MPGDVGPSNREVLRTGVVGCGALGRHHVRLLSVIEESDLVGIYEPDAERAKAIGEEFGVELFGSWGALAEAADAIVVAAPTVMHAEIGVDLLEAGRHVLVEKPIATDLAEADRLIAAARAKDRILAVGHVEFYNPAVQSLLAIQERARFIDIDRLSVFSPRSLDIDVVLDLMIHDLQIVHALDPSPLTEVRATGINVLSERIDMAGARLELGSGAVVNVTASRVSSERVRQLRIFMENRYYSLDYQHQTLRGARLISSSEQAGGAEGKASETSAELPRRIHPEVVEVQSREPLRVELESFLAACRGESVAWVDGISGRRALESALRVVNAIEGSRPQS